MDDVPVDKIKDFQAKLTDFLTTRKAELMAKIRKEKAFSDALDRGIEERRSRNSSRPIK